MKKILLLAVLILTLQLQTKLFAQVQEDVENVVFNA